MQDTAAPSVEEIMALIDTDRLDDIQHALDDLVHDLAESDESIDTSGVEDPDEVLDLRSLWASELNNQGAEDQVRYIAQQGALGDIAPALATIAVSTHARLTLEALAAAA